MKKVRLIFGLLRFVLGLPFQIVKGNKKRAYRNIKKQLIQVDLL